MNIENAILELFYEIPDKEFTVREISKLTKLPRSTVHKYLVNLRKRLIITKANKAADTSLFKIKKINYYVEKVVSSGLIQYIINMLNPSCIILFGSIRKGESVKESDIDIFIESFVDKDLELEKFEKILKHRIQLHVENDINNLQPTLFNNVVNGIKIHGSFKIK